LGRSARRAEAFALRPSFMPEFPRRHPLGRWVNRGNGNPVGSEKELFLEPYPGLDDPTPDTSCPPATGLAGERFLALRSAARTLPIHDLTHLRNPTARRRRTRQIGAGTFGSRDHLDHSRHLLSRPARHGRRCRGCDGRYPRLTRLQYGCSKGSPKVALGPPFILFENVSFYL
jgi:hypothetical protein